MDWLIHNGIIVTMDVERKIFRQGAIVIKDDRIVDIGHQDDILRSYPDIRKYDAKGKAILPGLVNLHTHTSFTALRGVAEDLGIKSVHLMGSLQELMTPQDKYVMALLGCLEALKSGTTCIVENSDNMEDIVKAFDLIGVRAVVSQIVRDVDAASWENETYYIDQKMGQELLAKGVDLVEKWHGKDNGRILCQLSPHAPDTCSTPLLKEIKSVAEKLDVRLHMHLSQSPTEVEQVLSREGKRPVEYLASVELLGARLTAAHCVHINQKEIELLGNSKTNIAHLPAINARRSFIAPICALREAGANIGLGTDNMAEDMVEVLRLALLVGRIKTDKFDALLPDDVVEMATTSGAKALGLHKEIGSLEKGKQANIIMIDVNKPHLVPVINVLGNIVHTGMASDVDTVIVGGRILMEGREVKTVDEKGILEEAQKTGERLWGEYYRKYGWPLSTSFPL